MSGKVYRVPSAALADAIMREMEQNAAELLDSRELHEPSEPTASAPRAPRAYIAEPHNPRRADTESSRQRRAKTAAQDLRAAKQFKLVLGADPTDQGCTCLDHTYRRLSRAFDAVRADGMVTTAQLTAAWPRIWPYDHNRAKFN